jgi:DNA-binding phage protein
MTKRIKISDLPEFDAAEYLDSEEDIAAYLTTVIEENDPALLATAHGDIARARRKNEKSVLGEIPPHSSKHYPGA